jgi:hypothetical protein
MVHDTDGGRLGAVRNAATWARTSRRSSGLPPTFERQEQRAAHQIDPGDIRPLNAIDRALRRCRMGKAFLSDVPWLSGD